MQNKTFLITGAAGFIGARLVEECNKKGQAVISVDAKQHFTTRAEHNSIDFETVIDREELFDFLKGEKSEISAIFHIGACSNTTEMNEQYLRKMNVEYSQKLWSYAVEKKLPFIYASSAATYGAGELGYSDDEKLIERLRPLNPYGESKRVFDLWALKQEEAGNTPPFWSGFKFFNVYGFGERHKNKMASVILHAFDQIRTTGKVKLFKSHRTGIADGEQKRDFIYVRDVVDVLFFAENQKLKRGIFNLGTGKARTFLDLVNATFKALGRKPEIEFIDTPISIRERYQYFTQAEMSRLRSVGYTKPFTSLEEGVADYIKKLLELS